MNGCDVVDDVGLLGRWCRRTRHVYGWHFGGDWFTFGHEVRGLGLNMELLDAEGDED